MGRKKLEELIMKHQNIDWCARDVMATLERYDPTGRGLTITELAAVYARRRSWVTGAVLRLEADGLVVNIGSASRPRFVAASKRTPRPTFTDGGLPG